MSLPRTPSFRLDGRRALVTGASRGIGLGCAVALAEQGAHVVMAARGTSILEAAVAEMAAQGLSAEALPLDVTDTGAVKAAVAAKGPFDVLVNSAGMARHAPALDTAMADYEAVMAVNVRAAFVLAAEVARTMVGRGGSIIQISSQMAHVGGQERAVYCATKHAVEGMTKAMALEWAGEQIRVNTICPTFIRTELAEQTLKIPEKKAWIESKIALGRVGEVADIMGAVQWLASDAAALVTGSSVLIDGGWTAD